jgi:cysteinyl-tRNA synthetase
MSMQELKFVDTFSGNLETFTPIKKGEVSLYTCGPTVYDYAHIGNFRAYIFEDLLHRVLKWAGYRVNQVMNITDVDDKTIEKAMASNISLGEFTGKYQDAFFADLKSLKITPAQSYPRATDYIPQMIKLIESLIEKDLAYVGDDGSVYYRTAKFENYGKLSKKDLEANIAGARVSQDEYEKEEMSDFALWKKKKMDGEPCWESPWGEGRPGWHIECSAMAMDLLGDQFDMHTGGEDNIFPHHENEIAQSEGSTGKKFVNYWLHCRFLLVGGEKMSKSKGNFYTLRDLVDKGYDPVVVRYLLLVHNYRHPLNFTEEGLKAASESIKRLQDFWVRLEEYSAKDTRPADDLLDMFQKQFRKGISEDLNIAHSLAALFECMNDANKKMSRKGLTLSEKKSLLKFMEEADSILDCMKLEKAEVPDLINELLSKREEARKSKDFSEADRLRDEILSSGFVLEDTSEGVRVKKA